MTGLSFLDIVIKVEPTKQIDLTSYVIYASLRVK
jgi:hypothetical protein